MTFISRELIIIQKLSILSAYNLEPDGEVREKYTDKNLQQGNKQ